MLTRRIVGTAAFAGAAASSAALGYFAKRRALADVNLAATSEWGELHRPVHGDPVTVRSFDGTALHAEVLGPPDAPTLVFAHGYALSQHSWHYQRRALRDEFRLVCYDQRGHGASEEAASGDYSIRALGRDFAAVVDAAVSADQALVAVGHSMGGMTVLSFADQFPERAEGLGGVALVSTAASNIVAGGAFTAGVAALSALRSSAWPGAGGRLGRLGRTPAEAGSDDPRDRTREPPADVGFLLTRALGLSPQADPAHIAFTEELMAQCPTRVKAALGPTVTSLRLRHAAEKLTGPALVVVGDHDRLTPHGQARRLAASLPRGRLVVLDGAGHMVPLEAHAQLSGELRDLARQAWQAAGIGPFGNPARGRESADAADGAPDRDGE